MSKEHRLRKLVEPLDDLITASGLQRTVTITGGNHICVTLIDGPFSHKLILAHTPSDWRAIRNARANCRRTITTLKQKREAYDSGA